MYRRSHSSVGQSVRPITVRCVVQARVGPLIVVRIGPRGSRLAALSLSLHLNFFQVTAGLIARLVTACGPKSVRSPVQARVGPLVVTSKSFRNGRRVRCMICSTPWAWTGATLGELLYDVNWLGMK